MHKRRRAQPPNDPEQLTVRRANTSRPVNIKNGIVLTTVDVVGAREALRNNAGEATPGIALWLQGERNTTGEPAQVLILVNSYTAAIILGALFDMTEKLGEAFRTELYRNLQEVIDRAQEAE